MGWPQRHFATADPQPDSLCTRARCIGGDWGETGNRDGSSNYTILVPDIGDFWSHVFRADHNLSERNRLFVRGDANRRKTIGENRYGNAAYGALYYRRNLGGGVDHVYVFRPNLLMNTRYSYTRYYDNADPRSMGIDLGGLGFAQGFVDEVKSIDPRSVSLPYINVGGYAPLSPSGVTRASREIHSLAANVTHIVRSHSLKYGYEFRAYRDFSANLGMNSGRFDHAADWTRGPLEERSLLRPLQDSRRDDCFRAEQLQTPRGC